MKILRKINKKIISIIILFTLTFNQYTALATTNKPPSSTPNATGGLEASKLNTGTLLFLNDTMGRLLILLPLIGGIIIAYSAVRMSMTSEEHEKSKFQKHMKNTLVCVVIGVSASGIVALITSYYI